MLKTCNPIHSEDIFREEILKPMDYNLVLSELQKASMFDLFRLQAAIGKLLDDPARLIAIKHALRPGMEITYFHEQGNRLVPARVLQIRKTRVAVQDLETGKRCAQECQSRGGCRNLMKDLLKESFDVIIEPERLVVQASV